MVWWCQLDAKLFYIGASLGKPSQPYMIMDGGAHDVSSSGPTSTMHSCRQGAMGLCVTTKTVQAMLQHLRIFSSSGNKHAPS